MEKVVPFLDRSSEIDVLHRGWREASSNRGVLTFATGGAGFGKSTLLKSWAGQLRPRVHVSIEFSSNLGATTSTVIDAFQSVIENLAPDIDRWKDPLRGILGRDGSGIGEIFPRFPWSTWFQPTAALFDKQQLDRRFLILLKALLKVWSSFYGPLLVTVDDWHLADDALQQLLLQLWQPEVGLCCVAASRLAPQNLPLVFQERPLDWVLHALELKPFTDAEVRSWVDRLFSAESTGRREFYADLCTHARGNPLYLQEIRRLIAQDKVDEKALKSLDSWFLGQVQDLPFDLRKFLEAGAVLGKTFSPDAAVACAALEAESPRLVAAAVERRLVEVQGTACHWVHDLVRDAIQQLIDPDLHAALCGRAAVGIIRSPAPDTEQVLRFPSFFQGGGAGLRLSAPDTARAARLLREAAQLRRRAMDHEGAQSACALLRSTLEATSQDIPDEVLLFSAEVSFEQGHMEEAIKFLLEIRGSGSPVMRLTRELILCRCYYVERDFTGIFKRIASFSGILWPARLIALPGPAVIGFISSLVIPRLFRRMGRGSPQRISHRRELTEDLLIGLVIFTFQHEHALSAALGLMFVVLSAFSSSSRNLPMAGIVCGMFGNLPRFARRTSRSLARLARDVQLNRGNPFWNDRMEFLFSLLFVNHISGVRAAFSSLREMIVPGSRMKDPEVESLVKLTLIPNYFWSNTRMETLLQEMQRHAGEAQENNNPGLAAIFETFASLLGRCIRGEAHPYRFFDDAASEEFLFHALKERNELIVASGLRFEQAFFAILTGDFGAAREFILKARKFPRDTSYWMSQVSDAYIECLALLLTDGAESVTPAYRTLRSAVQQNMREFGPYLVHVDAEIARSRGQFDKAFAGYRRARGLFHRLSRPILAALVDWRTGDLLWDSSHADIARAFLDRSIRQFQQSDMNAGVNAIRTCYGLETAVPRNAKAEDEELMTMALRLHRLTLLGRLASEIAHEIKNVNHTLRLSAAVLATDLASIGEESDLREPVAGLMPAARAIQDSAGTIDRYLSQFRLTAGETAVPATTPIDLGEVIELTVSFMAPAIRQFTAKFENTLPPGRHHISGQLPRIHQLVMNLVLNACESLSHRDQAVRLEEAADPSRQLVGFRLTDEGCGIPDELLQRVLEPFFTTKRDKGGTGLGLALCKRIVEEHQGELRLDSRQGEGTSVTVLFPSRNGG
jgi:signal transduction histidine kinase